MTAGAQFGRRLTRIQGGSAAGGTAGAGGELWFVLGGTGALEADGHPGLPLRRDRGVWVPPGARYRVRGNGPAELCFDAVSLPAATAGPGGQASQPLARDLRDCAVQTTGDRQFRVLFGPGRDCSVATQFAGEIPPGRAPEHCHPYDELVLVLAGEGVLHVAGAGQPVSAGTSAHLRPGQMHCLENTGTTTLRVLGVFHPADSPAAKSPPAQPGRHAQPRT